jgi:peroxiredoxin
MFNTVEMGPRLNTPALGFALYNHENRISHLDELVGPRGLLLGFTGDIWQPASVRRILWFQRHYPRFLRLGVDVSLLICDKPHMLYGFYMSSVIPVGFPLLADVDRAVHRQFSMERYSGLVLLDRDGVIRDKWLVPDERVWPKEQELLQSFNLL